MYEGITGGSDHWGNPGGGANYVCLPKIPQYMSTHVPGCILLHVWYSISTC